MQKIAEAADEFLAHHRIAVTGVSRSAENHGANVVYKRLRERGYHVFAVNPNTTEVEGDAAYPNLASIPDGVEAVVIGTAPGHAEATVRECIDTGVTHIWFHRGPGGGSANPDAARLARDHELHVIDGGCPCMFGATADLGHKIMRPLLQLKGNVPRRV
jgi:predicted CoA-binding protein